MIVFNLLGNCSMRCSTSCIHAVVTPAQCFRSVLPGTLRALSTRPNPLLADLSSRRGGFVVAKEG